MGPSDKTLRSAKQLNQAPGPANPNTNPTHPLQPGCTLCASVVWENLMAGKHTAELLCKNYHGTLRVKCLAMENEPVQHVCIPIENRDVPLPY